MIIKIFNRLSTNYDENTRSKIQNNNEKISLIKFLFRILENNQTGLQVIRHVENKIKSSLQMKLKDFLSCYNNGDDIEQQNSVK